MMPRRIMAVAAIAAAALATGPLAVPLAAQQHVDGAWRGRLAADSTWTNRLSVSARVGTMGTARGSELYALLDDALTPGGRMLRPRIVGADVHVRIAGRWGVVAGAEVGSRSVSSESQVLPEPAPASGEVRQRTSYRLTAVQQASVEWMAHQWQATGRDTLYRPRLVLGAGVGRARYALRQWGEFVDVERRMAFADDLRSSGSGTFGFGSVVLEVPLYERVALRGDLRHQVGSASMNRDYATFDRLDLGGTMFSIGLLFHPAGSVSRR